MKPLLKFGMFKAGVTAVASNSLFLATVKMTASGKDVKVIVYSISLADITIRASCVPYLPSYEAVVYFTAMSTLPRKLLHS
jgi:hypothetical protein